MLRIIVSAPNGTATNAEVENTGVLFVCPVAQGTCEPLTGNNNGFDRRLYDVEGMSMTRWSISKLIAFHNFTILLLNVTHFLVLQIMQVEIKKTTSFLVCLWTVKTICLL